MGHRKPLLALRRQDAVGTVTRVLYDALDETRDQGAGIGIG